VKCDPSIPPATSSGFYVALPSFANFRDFTNDRHFTRAPDDWFVVITDVKGSLKAIEAGRYKDVNTVGAASISVVSDLLKQDFPYVFGGDGATLLVPPDAIDRVLDGLKRLQRLSTEQFQIELRVGRITVGEIHQAGCVIEVARHELTAGRCVAVFRGGGLSEAEKRIKDDVAKYCCQYDLAEDLELTGLSCRWNPLASRRGRIMALLVVARGETAAIYNDFFAALSGIYGGHLDEANPVNPDLMRYNTVGACMKNETRFHSRNITLGYLKRLWEIFAAVLIFKFRVPPLVFDATHYLDSMRTHADHRKFDDMLRMVLDCSNDQADAIRDYLEARRAAGELCYGIHLSDTALMTCYVQDLNDGGHIHFIDGGDGGYAVAAKQLKQQLRES